MRRPCGLRRRACTVTKSPCAVATITTAPPPWHMPHQCIPRPSQHGNAPHHRRPLESGAGAGLARLLQNFRKRAPRNTCHRQNRFPVGIFSRESSSKTGLGLVAQRPLANRPPSRWHHRANGGRWRWRVAGPLLHTQRVCISGPRCHREVARPRHIAVCGARCAWRVCEWVLRVMPLSIRSMRADGMVSCPTGGRSGTCGRSWKQHGGDRMPPCSGHRNGLHTHAAAWAGRAVFQVRWTPSEDTHNDAGRGPIRGRPDSRTAMKWLMCTHDGGGGTRVLERADGRLSPRFFSRQ